MRVQLRRPAVYEAVREEAWTKARQAKAHARLAADEKSDFKLVRRLFLREVSHHRAVLERSRCSRQVRPWQSYYLGFNVLKVSLKEMPQTAPLKIKN